MFSKETKQKIKYGPPHIRASLGFIQVVLRLVEFSLGCLTYLKSHVIFIVFQALLLGVVGWAYAFLEARILRTIVREFPRILPRFKRGLRFCLNTPRNYFSSTLKYRQTYQQLVISEHQLKQEDQLTRLCAVLRIITETAREESKREEADRVARYVAD